MLLYGKTNIIYITEDLSMKKVLKIVGIIIGAYAVWNTLVWAWVGMGHHFSRVKNENPWLTHTTWSWLAELRREASENWRWFFKVLKEARAK